MKHIATIWAILIFLLNIIDAFMTMHWVKHGIAEEGNPLMAPLLAHPILFLSVKLTLVALGIYLLWKNHHEKLAMIGLFALLTIYGFILNIHIGILAL